MSVHFHDSLVPLLTDISTLQQHPENPNNGDVEMIVELILRHGFTSPLIVQTSTRYIVAGNHRYQALLALGETRAPVVWVDMDDEQAEEYLVADNRAAEVGERDPHALHNILQRIAERDRLASAGYTDNGVRALADRLRRIEHTPLLGGDSGIGSGERYAKVAKPCVVVEGWDTGGEDFQAFTAGDLPDTVIRLTDLGYKVRGSYDK